MTARKQYVIPKNIAGFNYCDAFLSIINFTNNLYNEHGL